MPRVTLQNVSKIFPGEDQQDLTAVEDFNLEVEDGEFVVLAGPAGCGKSTVLRLLAGLEDLSTGAVTIDGRRVNDLPPQHRDIAMVFQNDTLHPHLSVYDNLVFALKLRKLPRPEIKKRVGEAAALLGLEPSLALKANVLTAAERQRVAIGSAIVRRPKVFLFDEPLSNLDPNMRLQMRTEIIKLHQRVQATMIYATHDQVEAMTMGDRIVVMKGGLVQQIGSPLHLYHQPANLFVAGFLGSPPINFVHGKLSGSGDTVIFKEHQDGAIQCKFADRPEVKAFIGQEIVIGIRPENLKVIVGATSRPANGFTAIVELIEVMGGETNLHLQTGSHTLICRTGIALEHSEVGHRHFFEIVTTEMHLFDPVTTQRIK